MKKNIIPIIIPTQQYTDRFGNQNVYVEMNPSIYIKDGCYTVLVRTVNYLKNKDKSFTIYGHFSNTIYSIIRGKIEDNFNLDNGHVTNMEIKYNIPTYESWWHGVEDIRFIDETHVLACIPECNNNAPCIFKGVLSGNILSSFEKCNPCITEKNWMPYGDKVIYSVYPFRIKSIVDDDCEEIEVDEELKGWHGSSNGIDFMDKKLFLIHQNRERTYNRWLLFSPKSIQYSKEFVFFKDSYLEFTCSLAKHNKIYVSIGVNDNKAYIIEIDEEEIKKVLNKVLTKF